MKFFVIAFAVIAAASAASISSDYLPPVADNSLPSQEYIPPATEDQSVRSDDGYRYKVVRKLRLRHRRDVNELPSNEYLPPTEESQESVVVEAPEEKTELADDGYRYKVVRRIRYRHRRDVNELPSNEYLPPTEESQESAVVEAPEEKTELADDGYRYKVVRRIRYRHRRDVNELPSNEYLPPTEESQESVVVEAPEEKTELADDGYRYKVVRRIRYRHRRDVNELLSNEYLPPTAESQESAVVEAPEEKTELADDGYRYKVVRRLRYRHRRDVNELPSNEYLPPTTAESQDQEVAVESPEESAVLAADGYRYKTVRRLKYRRH